MTITFIQCQLSGGVGVGNLLVQKKILSAGSDQFNDVCLLILLPSVYLDLLTSSRPQ